MVDYGTEFIDLDAFPQAHTIRIVSDHENNFPIILLYGDGGKILASASASLELVECLNHWYETGGSFGYAKH